MNPERNARLLILGVLLGLPLAILLARWLPPASAAGKVIEVHGRMAESGGWEPGDLTAQVGQPLRLRLTSDDVMHGFAVGQVDWPAIDVQPGQVVETTLKFDKPGKYVYYCTRWCGLNHWRMRGTIEVTGTGELAAESEPLYVRLGLDIDAPHPAAAIPDKKPSAARGQALGLSLPDRYLDNDNYRRSAPAETWQALREEPITQGLTDAQLWDLVALTWARNTTPQVIETGRQLYAQNCAACHGESGGGDGVMTGQITGLGDSMEGHPTGGEAIAKTKGPSDFTDPASLLGASPALLQGKILRGGMGTGMPYWGPIFTEDQTWALVAYLQSFQFELDGGMEVMNDQK